MGTDSGGVSRRRVLIGTAWTAPVILVATSAPARAASLPSGGIAFTHLNAWSYENFYIQPGNHLAVIVAEVGLQNVPGDDNAPPPTARSLSLTFHVELDGIQSPRWGLGYNGEGVNAADWTHSSGPSVNPDTNVATIAFNYGADIPAYQTARATLWIETTALVSNPSVDATVVAVHDDDYTSSDARIASATQSGEPPDPDDIPGFDYTDEVSP